MTCRPYGDNGEYKGLTVWLTVWIVWHLQPYGLCGNSWPAVTQMYQMRGQQLAGSDTNVPDPSS